MSNVVAVQMCLCDGCMDGTAHVLYVENDAIDRSKIEANREAAELARVIAHGNAPASDED